MTPAEVVALPPVPALRTAPLEQPDGRMGSAATVEIDQPEHRPELRPALVVVVTPALLRQAEALGWRGGADAQILTWALEALSKRTEVARG